MDNVTNAAERSAVINIGGKDYELVLTTRATKAIAGRYGGLENLGEKLMKSENFEMALDEIVWLLTLLANQSVLIHNLKNKDNPQELLTEDEVELLTSRSEEHTSELHSPYDLVCRIIDRKSTRLNSSHRTISYAVS